MVNVANEWGPTGTTWQYAYQDVTYTISGAAGTTITVNSPAAANPFLNTQVAYISGTCGLTKQVIQLSAPGGTAGAWTVQSSVSLSGYTGAGCNLNGGAIGVLRAAGYTCPILIDSGNSGQDTTGIVSYGQSILASDPEQNVMFAYHGYGSATNTEAPIYSITSSGGNSTVTLNNSFPYHPFAPNYPITTSNTYSGISAYQLSGVLGATSLNGTQPSTANIGGSAGAWTTTLTVPSSGYTGGGTISETSNYYQILSGLAALRASGVATCLCEFGPGSEYVPAIAFTGSISGTTLTVSAIQAGPIQAGVKSSGLGSGYYISGTGVPASEAITAQLTGTSGSTGTYTVSGTASIGSEAMAIVPTLGPSPTTTSAAQLVSAAEALQLPWVDWAYDDHDIGLNQATSWVGWFGWALLNTNYAVPSDLTGAGMDIVLNPRYGLGALAAPAAYLQ
jgi:hypothetical protein